MRTISHIILATAATLLATSASAQAPQDCSLKQVASLPMTVTASGRIDVPVKIDGTDQMMELALTNELTILDQEFVGSAEAQDQRSSTPYRPRTIIRHGRSRHP